MPQKTKVVLRSPQPQTCRDLRSLLAEWCDLHPVTDLKSLDLFCREHDQPRALIVEPAPPSPLDPNAAQAKRELMDFLGSTRRNYPAMRCVVIADPEDLSAAIHGLHARSIDGVLHRPFDIAHVLTALGLDKPRPLLARPADYIGQ